MSAITSPPSAIIVATSRGSEGPVVPLQTSWQAGYEGMIGVLVKEVAVGRPPVIPVEKKTRIVLSVLAGEMSIAEAARKEQVSEQSIGRWKAEFVEGGRTRWWRAVGTVDPRAAA